MKPDATPKYISDIPWDEERRRRMARVMVRLFEYWQLPLDKQSQLIGISAESLSDPALCDRCSLPDLPNVRVRVGYLLGIHRALKILYPANSEIVRSWVNVPMSAFSGMAPIDLMTSTEVSGLAAVHQYLIEQLES